MILSQLVDADELKALSPEELRDMLLRLDDEVVYGADEDGETEAAETPATADAAEPAAGEQKA